MTHALWVSHVGSCVPGSRDSGRDTAVADAGEGMVVGAVGTDREWKREKARG